MRPCPDLPYVRFIQPEETDSTNSYLKQLCEREKTEEFTVVATECQSAGRGQRGNFWESETGMNLTFSILLRPSFLPAKEQFLISQIVSLSIKEELDRYGKDFSIKWPNDIYWNEYKICGILIENNLMGNNISESVIGIGINVNQQAFKSSAPNPISLCRITGIKHDRTVILASILQRLHRYYGMLENNNIRDITANYHNALFRKEGFHPYTDKDGEFTARIIETEPEGFLKLIDSNGKERSYAFKEVSFVLSNKPSL